MYVHVPSNSCGLPDKDMLKSCILNVLKQLCSVITCVGECGPMLNGADNKNDRNIGCIMNV